MRKWVKGRTILFGVDTSEEEDSGGSLFWWGRCSWYDWSARGGTNFENSKKIATTTTPASTFSKSAVAYEEVPSAGERGPNGLTERLRVNSKGTKWVLLQNLVEKHFPAPDRNKIERLLGISLNDSVLEEPSENYFCTVPSLCAFRIKWTNKYSSEV